MRLAPSLKLCRLPNIGNFLETYYQIRLNGRNSLSEVLCEICKILRKTTAMEFIRHESKQAFYCGLHIQGWLKEFCLLKDSQMRTRINSLHAIVIFIYPLKTSKNRGFLMFSGGIERYQWHKMRLKETIEVMSHVECVQILHLLVQSQTLGKFWNTFKVNSKDTRTT